jgi:hypothetical protein
MNKITFVYGNDLSSEKALSEIEFIKNKHFEKLEEHNIEIIKKKDIELGDFDLNVDAVPLLYMEKVIDNENITDILTGYDLNNDSFYTIEIFTFFNILDFKENPDFIFNKETLKWEAPAPAPKSYKGHWDIYEER